MERLEGDQPPGTEDLWDDDASLADVKEFLRNEKSRYGIFKQIMKDVEDNSTDLADGRARIKDLFKGSNRSIHRLYNSVPKEYEIIFDKDVAPPREMEFLCVFNQGFVFSEKLKQRLGSFDEYRMFLNGMRDFPKGTMRIHGLQNPVKGILEKHPELMDEFVWFLENGNIDEFLAGALSKEPLDVEDKEREQKRSIGENRKRDRGKEKYKSNPISKLDLSNCYSITPSYRLIPADYPIASSSCRSELACQVLNDLWVICTSGCEDPKRMRKNKYEESLFKCEDNRIELDILLNILSSCAQRAEELLKMINEYGLGPKKPIRIKDYFTSMNLRCIERMYVDRGLDMIDILRTNPKHAVPLLLARFKQKEEELKRYKKETNETEDIAPTGTQYESMVDDGMAYLKKVREAFPEDQNNIYDTFVALVENLNATRTDIAGVHARVKELLKGHNDLILGFNDFLPEGYKINLHEDGAPTRIERDLTECAGPSKM